MNKRKILVIEDNESMREMLKEHLELNGYEIITGADGQEGINLFKKYSDFDLVITDFEMPKVNGIEIIKFIRQKDSNIKIILLSGDDIRLVYPAAINAGADKVISKNFDLNLSYISKTVKELLVR